MFTLGFSVQGEISRRGRRLQETNRNPLTWEKRKEERMNCKNERAMHTIPGKGMFRACLGNLLDQPGNSAESLIKGKFSEVVLDLQKYPGL